MLICSLIGVDNCALVLVAYCFGSHGFVNIDEVCHYCFCVFGAFGFFKDEGFGINIRDI